MPPSVVRVRLFATARTAVGRAAVEVEVPPAGVTARELVATLAERFPRLRPILASSRFLRNDRYVDDLAAVVRSGDEFAVHPPYSGG